MTAIVICPPHRGPRSLAASTPAQNRTNAAWVRAQTSKLHDQIRYAISAGKGQRWPLARVATALRAIGDGDEQWQIHAADVLR